MRTGGQILIDCLKIQGAEIAFGVPGESYLAALDALHDTPAMQFITCRQEGGAAMMADAYGKMTGKPGLCFVTRGPGATNASAGVHIAYQDSTPMILFIGQVERGNIEREAFQEMDYRRMFSQMAKWVTQIDDPDRIPEYINRAWHTAISGRPGPVVLTLPEDMLRQTSNATDIPPHKEVQSHPSGDDLEQVSFLLKHAQRPFVIVGDSGWDTKSCENLMTFAENWNLPVGTSFRSHDRIDNTHPSYAGDVGIGINPDLAERIKAADLVLAIGSRLGEVTTSNYTLLKAPEPDQKLIHVYPGVEELNHVYRPTLAINASVSAFMDAASALPATQGDWDDNTHEAHESYKAWSTPPATAAGDTHLGEIVKWLNHNVPTDTFICNGAGNYSFWVHRFYQYSHYRSQLAPTNGAMGYGTPAAVAAKLMHPDREVIAFAGDGCFLMNGQEFATAVQYGANIIVIVVNNAMYGTIRMHQEREYPGRVSGTTLSNPDFAALAVAYGGYGEQVKRTEDFPAAFERAKASGKPAIIEVLQDPESINPNRTLSDIREIATANMKDE
jgi:acetolactate synthase I/II/III large subunit